MACRFTSPSLRLGLAGRRTRRQKKAVIVQDRTRPTSARLRSASRKRIGDDKEPTEVKKGRRASTALTRAVASVDQYKPQAKLTKSRMTVSKRSMWLPLGLLADPDLLPISSASARASQVGRLQPRGQLKATALLSTPYLSNGTSQSRSGL